MNRTACGIIRSYLIQDLKYDVKSETSAKSIWEILVSKYLTNSVENRLHLKRRLYRFQLKRGTSISDHININTKVDLTNLDALIEDEDKALILLSFLSDEGYETYVLILINGRTSLSYSKVTTLVNLELRRKDKECSTSDSSAEVVAARGSSPNRKSENQQKFNWKSVVGNRRLEKGQYAFFKEKGH